MASSIAFQNLLSGKGSMPTTKAREVCEWPSDLTMRPKAASKPHNQRPRTTPPRLFERNCVRSRSPSSPMLVPGSRNDKMKQLENGGADEAYFSTQPPPAPMKIMLDDDGTAATACCERCIQRLQKINREIENICSSNEQVFAAAGSHTSILRLYQIPHNYPPFYSQIITVQKSVTARRLVHHLLHELVAYLPLTPNTFLNDNSSKLCRAVAACGPRSPSVRSCCSIAIQAHNRKSMSDVSNIGERGMNLDKLHSSKDANVPKEDWVGGVRALRDSHVRLVLRQLRHIERLNHALDRVSKANSHKAA